jgi:5-formyltetrahydrofolate cyclo-ligase
MPEYARARTFLTFVSFGTEVDTRRMLETADREGKSVVVTYCQDKELRLFRLEDPEQLTPGTWGLLEPRPELRELAKHAVNVGEIDLFLLPGLAFDRRGGRLGYGKGYFDRLLKLARNDATIVGIGFACQVFDQVPTLPHDIRMHWIVTEDGVHRCAK